MTNFIYFGFATICTFLFQIYLQYTIIINHPLGLKPEKKLMIFAKESYEGGDGDLINSQDKGPVAKFIC